MHTLNQYRIHHRNVTLSFNTWSNLGTAVESPIGSGQFQFTDPQATNYPDRFYRVTSP